MNNVVDITQVRADRSGIITPARVLEDAQANVEDIAAIVVVSLTRDGVVVTGCSSANMVTVLGMLAIAKDNVICGEGCVE